MGVLELHLGWRMEVMQTAWFRSRLSKSPGEERVVIENRAGFWSFS